MQWCSLPPARNAPDLLEIVSAGACATFGAWLLAPWWNTYALSRAYGALAVLLPEGALGLVLLAVGVGGAVAARWGTATARRAMLLGQGALWLFLAATFVVSAPGAAGSALFGAVGAGCFAAWWQLGGRGE